LHFAVIIRRTNFDKIGVATKTFVVEVKNIDPIFLIAQYAMG
jgi:hypothetical protein